MENFVFPNEIKTKLMKMNKLINIFYAKEPNILRERAKVKIFQLKGQKTAKFHPVFKRK